MNLGAAVTSSQCMRVLALVFSVPFVALGCSAPAPGETPGRTTKKRSQTLEDLFISPLGYDAAFGTILTGDLQISPEFNEREVVIAIITFLKQEPSAMGTAIGSGDFQDTRVRSVDFWAVVLQEVTGVQSDGPINARVAPSVRDLSIRGLVSKVETLRGHH